ncbi:SMP-30/gluconolactonase/LRE family protein [Psychromonas sp. SA13A]|uniref:SMP-30/gluconolactonase/LRE family protein n=1 Tax=Psychromonas sp. SA13A TaxID=2686346 RepID=UPI00140CF361|nr:SMP-30/gluconolactonase/LRE family protein [Psychromonas sp. SA13A]
MNQISGVKKLTSHCCLLAEGPLWLAQSHELLFVDIHNGKLLCSDEFGTLLQEFTFPEEVSAVVHCDQRYVVVASGCTLYYLDRSNGQYTALLTVPGVSDNLRFNDGKVDPYGNLWIGTMDKAEIQPKACLYRITPELEVSVVLKGITVSNGLDWDIKKQCMYYVDSPSKSVMCYSIDFENGTLSDAQLVYQLLQQEVFPDGLCIDSEGFIWLALWGGSSVIKIDPTTKQQVQRLWLPTNKVTSCAFGGPNFSTLYITTASISEDKEVAIKNDAGAVYTYTPHIGGKAPTPFNLTKLP